MRPSLHLVDLRPHVCKLLMWFCGLVCMFLKVLCIADLHDSVGMACSFRYVPALFPVRLEEMKRAHQWSVWPCVS